MMLCPQNRVFLIVFPCAVLKCFVPVSASCGALVTPCNKKRMIVRCALRAHYRKQTQNVANACDELRKVITGLESKIGQCEDALKTQQKRVLELDATRKDLEDKLEHHVRTCARVCVCVCVCA